VIINGQPVKIKDVLADFFRSQEFVRLYEQLMRLMRHLWSFYMKFGFKGIWQHMWTMLDSESEMQAFEVDRRMTEY
jgi:hypothetical protein